MFDKLEQLRQKPDRIKHLIAFGVAFCLTAVIFVFWFVSFSVSTQAQLAQNQQDATFDASSVSVSPLDALKANVMGALAPVGASFGNLMAYFSGGATSTVTTSSDASSGVSSSSATSVSTGPLSGQEMDVYTATSTDAADASEN